MTTAAFTIRSGNVVRASVIFTPEAPATVALADVSARYIKRDGTVVAVTDIAADGVNVFYADVTVPDAEPEGWWQFRWKSNPPSAKISIENVTCRLAIDPSIFPVP